MPKIGEIEKLCSRCGEISVHNIRRRLVRGKWKDQDEWMCHRCMVAYRNMNKYKRNVIVKRKCVEYLGGKCQNCGLVDECPDIFDFHHRNPSVKSFGVGREIQKQGVFSASIKKELDKCDLLCAICHRKLHYAEWKAAAALREKEFWHKRDLARRTNSS